MISGSEQTIDIVRDAVRALRSPVCSLADEIKAIDRAEKALAVAKAERLAEMEQSLAHESDGASSITVWARRELGQDAFVTRAQVRAAATVRELPEVGEAAHDGRLAMRHLESFSYALKHVEVEQVHRREKSMVAAAKSSAPHDFHQRVRHLRDCLHPDDLDLAYLRGMDKRDVRLAKTIGGWHLTGFLDIETGAKLRAVLQNLSVPREADDVRMPSQRRMDGLELLLNRVLENGLPSDNGIRPHVMVTVTSEALQALAHPDQALPETVEPAVLHGFGAIGRVLLAALLGDAEITPILIERVEPNPAVLDVGDSHRRATPKQAKAIWLRQGGECASDGCHHPIAHNHHQHWWSNSHRTALDAMDGRCSKCHALIHARKLRVPGFTLSGWPEHHRRIG